MKKIYLLISKIGQGKPSVRRLYLIEASKAYELQYSDKTIGFNVNYNLYKSRRSWVIDESKDLLDDIYDNDEIMSKYPDLKEYDSLVESENFPGDYLPRIWRPVITQLGLKNRLGRRYPTALDDLFIYIPDFPNQDENMINGINQLRILIDELSKIFLTIEPIGNNFGCYGHSLRNLLILVCTEVEAQFKGVLRLHEQTSKERYNTSDYIKILPVMRLNKYKIKFRYYPAIEPLVPFLDWVESNPTGSLSWYHSYNAVKHDREKEFSKATLENVIEAISALAILIIGQYGTENSYWQSKISPFFEILTEPEWLFQEKLLPPFKEQDWKSKKLHL